MKYRKVEIFTGRTFQVPERIQRIDSHSSDGSGAAAALKLAIAELRRRITRMPAATGLRTQTHSRKSSRLPVGISGPKERWPAGRNVPYYEYGVSIPRFGQTSTNRNVYIGTKNTITAKRKAEALAKAIAIREQAVRKFKLVATKSKRAMIDKRERK
jgi:hypothetical protein